MLHFARIIGLLGTLLISAQVLAVGLGDLSGKEASAGLKEALSRGADMAVSQLGKPNGFMGDARVRIPLPKSLRAAEKMMRTLGMKKQAEELIETMNRAAELAVVEAKPILLESVQKMTIDDARGILAGGDDAATQYFRRTTSTALGKKFLPIVKQATAKVQLADQYNEYAGQAAKLGLLEEKDANLDSYVTQKALDGLFVMIAEQEKSIRQDPVGTGSKLLQTVFGAVGK
ncbi:DUF4197 domain-containing protein [Accumulibacter sp.]|uniref:DUF4197 domain-containing protein n=1 Tax=Accumulibacter sp. TaxID=2053492 RepID=UPI001AC27C2B|nr:DUF4197 domain-containing protein [Accumulibacter sp.]MBN8495424.1 DUF4197 domain-containing protein [Accumulibacter sp.]MBO3714042.1 DUF4197 domain-containing protein [Accumulibacter sp.]